MIKTEIKEKLDTARLRHEEVGLMLAEPDTVNDQKRYRDLSREYAHLQPLVNHYTEYLHCEAELKAAEELLGDPEMQELAEESVSENRAELQRLGEELQRLLIPKDPDDDKDIYLEVRAGTGGDEAAIFAGDLFRLYSRYAESKRWRVELISVNEGDHGGFKEVIARLSGESVYAHFKFESGVHRVQRVPETESQGRVHTSACTVAILPAVEDIEAVHIEPSELKIDTFRASGAGGQHVNTTDSAIRITHLPTQTVVECQDERSQHKNKAKAMALLGARLLDRQRAEQTAEQSESRRVQVGSGDRSQRIRTYNYPQGRITDHRINLTLYKLDEFMNGDLDLVVTPLTQHHQAEALAGSKN